MNNPILGALEGERYTTQVPDTLDLAERMALAVNALTNVFDARERQALYFTAHFSCRPPVLTANHPMDAFLNIPPKFIEALALCRLASGTDLNVATDAALLAEQVTLVGEDGLSYAPADAMVRLQHPGMERPFAEVWAEGRNLIAFSMLAQLDDDPLWPELARRKIDKMLSLTREKQGYLYLWKTRYRPGDQPNGAPEPDDLWPVIYATGALGHGSALFYRVSGYEPALVLAKGLALWAARRVFCNEDGRWNFPHFHHSLYSLIGVLEYALAAGDEGLLSRVDACYRYAREMGDSLLGYFPETMSGFPDNRFGDPRTVEICEVADMVVIALKLTRAGVGDYWDDVDLWTRNMYAEGQMTSPDFVERIPHTLLSPPPSAPYTDDREIAQRSVGAFWGWMRPNDGLCVAATEEGKRKLKSPSIMHCCTANGARSLYYVWDSIVTNQGDTTHVNLLLNRASPWVEVESYLPVQGRVVLRSKMAQRVTVRMPGWVKPSEVRITGGGARAAAGWEGQELDLGRLGPGVTVSLTFPVPERTFFRLIFNSPYKLTMRGANVVAIEPRGEACPLYEQQPTGALVTKSRFIPSKRVLW